MKNLPSQLLVATNKDRIFKKFATAMLGKTFVARAFSVKIESLKIDYETRQVKINNLDKNFDIPVDKINWFEANGKAGAWIEDFGAII
jgi:hypothetical protein